MVPAEASSIAVVRTAVRSLPDSLRREGLGPTTFDAERSADLALVVTELMTNAVLHGGGDERDQIEFRLSVEDGKIVGSITDPGSGFATQPGARPPRVDGGLGLFIVGRLARAWGVRRVRSGNQVWFEF